MSALDVSIQAQIITLLMRLREEFNLTYLFIAHDLAVVRNISDRVAVMYLGKIMEITSSDRLYDEPQHPYTISLLSAVPIPDPVIDRTRERIILKGDVPSPMNPPSGCPFHTRCPHAEEICKREVPELKSTGPNHWAACHPRRGILSASDQTDVKDSKKGAAKNPARSAARSAARNGSRNGSKSGARRPGTGGKQNTATPATLTLGLTQVVILVVVVAVIVGGVAGFAIYRDRVKPLQTKVLIVDDMSVDMRYFLKRVRMMGREPLEVMQLLTRELIITQVAVKPPYSIEVTEQDVENYMRETAARGDADTITDEEVKEWYRQTLNDSELKDAEFRELMRRNLLSLRLTDYLGERMPTVVEQVRLYIIVFASPEAGNGVMTQLEEGADFLELARSEANADEKLRATGGDLGWLPRGAMRPELAPVFDLPVGEPSRMLALGANAYAVAMVGERAAAREIAPEVLEAVKASALSNWFNEEYQYHTVEFHGFSNGYDSETDLWVKWQLQRMARHDNPEESR